MSVKELTELSQQVGRSTIAVIDTMTQRGAVKGEELSVIGRLRDQCSQMVNLAEQAQSAAENDVTDNPSKK